MRKRRTNGKTAGRESALRLDHYLPYRLSVSANAVSQLIACAYHARFGLTVPQWRLIAVLAEDGPQTQLELCTRTVMDKVAISRAAAALSERGLLSRTPNSADGRSHRVDLTAQGKSLFAEVAPLALRYEARLLETFSDSERRKAHNLLRRLEAAAAKLVELTEAEGG